MNALQLENILLGVEGYVGVHAINYVPVLNRVGEFLIFNTNCWPCQDFLGHWLAMFKISDTQVEFFDSYGHPPQSYGLSANPYYDLISSQQQLQSTNSNVCGHYCIWFLLSRAVNKSYEEILKMFSTTNLVANDNIVRELVTRLAIQQ